MSSIKVQQDSCVEPKAGPSTVVITNNEDPKSIKDSCEISEILESQSHDIALFLQKIESNPTLKLKYDRGIVVFMRYSDKTIESVVETRGLNLSYFRAYLKKLHPNYEQKGYRFKAAIEHILSDEKLKIKCDRAVRILEKQGVHKSYKSTAKRLEIPVIVLKCYMKYTFPDLKLLQEEDPKTITADDLLANPIKYAHTIAKLDKAVQYFLNKTSMGWARVAKKFAIKPTLLQNYMSIVEPNYKEKKQRFLDQFKVTIVNIMGTYTCPIRKCDIEASPPAYRRAAAEDHMMC
jgi:hypothetical protein